MFSWVDYFNNENSENNEIKLLKKSELCQNQNKKVKNYEEKIKISHRKIINKSNNKNLKKCSKILDLSPEEKEKIAALIRELGVLQSAKETISQELFNERQKFQNELLSMEKRYKNTLEDKERLAEELKKRNEKFETLELNESKNSKKELKYKDEMKNFVLIPKVMLENIYDSSNLPKLKDNVVPGPPSICRSQRMTSDLLQSYSSQSVEHSPPSDCNSLMKEQKELLIERKYLSILLKQEKCMKKLKSKISKLEQEYKHSRSSIQDSRDTPSTLTTDPLELVTPRVLNGSESGEVSLARSISVHSLSNTSSLSESTLLPNDDILLITALNHGLKGEGSSSRSHLRQDSDRDAVSLLQMINHIDQEHSLNYENTLPKPVSFKPPSEDDLLNDLFFRL